MNEGVKHLLRDEFFCTAIRAIVSQKISTENLIEAIAFATDRPDELDAVQCLVKNGYKYLLESADIEMIAAAKESELSLESDFHLPEEPPKSAFQAYVERRKITFVYLMRNNRNGLYKIGRSRTPKYREKTIQSEDPDVTMLHYYEASVGHERKWHEFFAEKRVRGEWFKLDEADVLKFTTFQ